MRTTATTLAMLALGAMLAVGSATESMAHGGGGGNHGGGGHGGGHGSHSGGFGGGGFGGDSRHGDGGRGSSGLSSVEKSPAAQLRQDRKLRGVDETTIPERFSAVSLLPETNSTTGSTESKLILTGDALRKPNLEPEVR